jgi:hypothetical protein
MKRLLAALALAFLAVPALADSAHDGNQADRTEHQAGYFDPSN